MSRQLSAMESLCATLPLFSELQPSAIRHLALNATECNVAKGTFVFRQGEPCRSLHLVVEGLVKLSVQTASGKEKIVELAGRGRALGKAALVLDTPHRVTAEALTDAKLVQIERELLLEQLRTNPAFARCLLRAVCRRLDQVTRDLESHLLLNGTQRVTAFLLDSLPPVNGVAIEHATVTLPARKSIIAAHLNLTQEHFSRILRSIEGAGLIDVRGRRIEVKAPVRLRDSLR